MARVFGQSISLCHRQLNKLHSTMYKLMILVLALVAVAAAQYYPAYGYGYNAARSGYVASPYVAASPLAYSGLGYRQAYGYGAYPYLG